MPVGRYGICHTARMCTENNPEKMTSSHSAMFYYHLLWTTFHGMSTSVLTRTKCIKRCTKWKGTSISKYVAFLFAIHWKFIYIYRVSYRNFAKVFLMNSRNISNMYENYVSVKSLITTVFVKFLKPAWKGYMRETTRDMIGEYINKILPKASPRANEKLLYSKLLTGKFALQ